jgi:hypothetical protein
VLPNSGKHHRICAALASVAVRVVPAVMRKRVIVPCAC